MQKTTEISERISEMLELLDSNPNSFAKKLNYQRAQTLYDIVNGKSAPSYDFFRRFQLSEYSDIISMNWLLTGRGEKLIKSNQSNINTNLNTNPNTNLSENIEKKNAYLSPISEESSFNTSLVAEPAGEYYATKDSNAIVKHLIEVLREQSEEIGALKQENTSLKSQLVKLADSAPNASSVPA